MISPEKMRSFLLRSAADRLLHRAPAAAAARRRTPALTSVRHLDLLEYQSKGLLQDYAVTVQKFRVAENEKEAAAIPGEFPCSEYVIKAQVLAGGRGKGTFDNGFKVRTKKPD